MIFIKRSILRRVLAAAIHSGVTLPAIPRWSRCILRLTVIVLDKPVPDLPALSNRQDTILHTMLAVQCTRVIAA
jgi:hypothetical protein